MCPTTHTRFHGNHSYIVVQVDETSQREVQSRGRDRGEREGREERGGGREGGKEGRERGVGGRERIEAMIEKGRWRGREGRRGRELVCPLSTTLYLFLSIRYASF